MSSFTGTAAERRVAVALSFDFDAESVWLGALQTDTPSALSRGAYSANEGVPRVLRLLDDYNLPATFFVPGDTADRHSDLTRQIFDGGYEIGHHGYLHEPPTTLSPAEESVMIERGIESLSRITGLLPEGYRSPSWELSNDTYALLEEYGIRYDASQLGADRPYWVRDRERLTDIVEVPSAWELCDSAHFWFSFFPTYRTGLASPSKVREIWLGDFDGAYEEGGDICYVLTMHPEIIGRHHRLRMLREILDHILSHDGIWFATMSDIAEDFRKRTNELAESAS